MILTTYTCERCQSTFEREGKKPYRFCSQLCSNHHAIKLTAKQLQPYAEKGLRSGYIAAQLKVSSTTLRRAMLEHGLYRLWASRRYLKCASPMVGSTSATTALSAAISPSAGLAAPQVGVTNCG